ncbi:hypothetical protein [Actinoplanes sp. NPDC048796]|uniref:hypothetical protein n=1 Tax=unclassified Actinoplanes TaxID=2626549 RepID=UPI0033D6A97D
MTKRLALWLAAGMLVAISLRVNGRDGLEALSWLFAIGGTVYVVTTNVRSPDAGRATETAVEVPAKNEESSIVAEPVPGHLDSKTPEPTPREEEPVEPNLGNAGKAHGWSQLRALIIMIVIVAGLIAAAESADWGGGGSGGSGRDPNCVPGWGNYCAL